MIGKIREGMNGLQVANLLDDNFKYLDNKVDVGIQEITEDVTNFKDNVNNTLDTQLTKYEEAIDKLVDDSIIAADEEDITSDKGFAKFADRMYDPDKFSGKGYKILRKKMYKGKNILFQEDINEPNTVYEIRYDFDLNGNTIKLKENVILLFNGGEIINGKVFSDNKTTKVINPPVINEGYNDEVYFGRFFDIEGFELTYKWDRMSTNVRLLMPDSNRDVTNFPFFTNRCKRKAGINSYNVMIYALPFSDNHVEFSNQGQAPIYSLSDFETLKSEFEEFNLHVPVIRFTIRNTVVDDPYNDDARPKTVTSTYNSKGLSLLTSYSNAVKNELMKYETIKDEIGLEYVGIINEFYATIAVKEYYNILKDLSKWVRTRGFKTVLSNSLPQNGILPEWVSFDDFDIFSYNYYPKIGCFSMNDQICLDDKNLQTGISELISYESLARLLYQNKNNDMYLSEIGILPYYNNLYLTYNGAPSDNIEKDETTKVISAFYINAYNAMKSVYNIKWFCPWFVEYYNKEQVEWMYNFFLKL